MKNWKKYIGAIAHIQVFTDFNAICLVHKENNSSVCGREITKDYKKFLYQLVTYDEKSYLNVVEELNIEKSPNAAFCLIN